MPTIYFDTFFYCPAPLALHLPSQLTGTMIASPASIVAAFPAPFLLPGTTFATTACHWY